jgi:uncharacterized protein YjlB
MTHAKVCWFRRTTSTNAWDSGIFTYDHYHSTSHEVLSIYKGSTTLQLGGASGVQLVIQKGDVLVIPVGVAHRNLGKEHQIKCVGAYPDGRKYDIKTGQPSEREEAERNISKLPVPEQDPAFGRGGGVPLIWRTPELYQTSQVVGF